jgi:tRNA A37 N6-isopentenylltransferase MiaA
MYRINQRVDIMMQHGLLTEAKGLHANRIECPANCWLSRIVQLSQGNSAYNLLSKKSKRFAKRQILVKEIKLQNGTILKRHIKQL